MSNLVDRRPTPSSISFFLSQNKMSLKIRRSHTKALCLPIQHAQFSRDVGRVASKVLNTLQYSDQWSLTDGQVMPNSWLDVSGTERSCCVNSGRSVCLEQSLFFFPKAHYSTVKNGQTRVERAEGEIIEERLTGGRQRGGKQELGTRKKSGSRMLS